MKPTTAKNAPPLMNRNLDPFYNAKLPFLGHCAIHARIADLKARTDAFIRDRHLVTFPEQDARTGDLIYKVKVVQDVPEDIERDATNYLIELRGALDKAVNGAAQRLGSPSLKHTNFPFGDKKGGANAFAQQLANKKGPWRGIPDELHAYLTDLKPFPTTDDQTKGNVLLVMLGELSNKAKHEDTLFVSIKIDRLCILEVSGSVDFPSVKTVWNDARDECAVFRISQANSSGTMKFAIPAQISFNGSDTSCRGDFASLLDKMARMTEEIVLGIEARTTETLNARINPSPA